jgi:hypothetical protein
MTIEKVFAIDGAPAAIWDALWSELGDGDPSRFAVESSRWPSSLSVRVDLGGLPTLIEYAIEPRAGGGCEVAARLQPLSARYALYQVLTLGRMRTNYELMLVQGLANLKEAVEGGPSEDGGPDAV